MYHVPIKCTDTLLEQLGPLSVRDRGDWAALTRALTPALTTRHSLKKLLMMQMAGRAHK